MSWVPHVSIWYWVPKTYFTCYYTEKSSSFHFSASSFGHRIFPNRGAGSHTGHAKGWKVCVHQTKKGDWPRNSTCSFLATLSFFIWGNFGSSVQWKTPVLPHRSLEANPLIWRTSPAKAGRTGLGLPSVWDERNVKTGCPGNQERWIPAPVPSLTTHATLGKLPWGRKKVVSEKTLQHFCSSVRVYSEKAQRTCISIRPLGPGFRSETKTSFCRVR